MIVNTNNRAHQPRIGRKLTVMALSGISLIATGLASPALAQVDADTEMDATIIVTAQRRAEAQVDVPITITTLGTEQLQTANVRDLTDIATVTPSLRFDGSSKFTSASIRGIGTGVVTSGGGTNVGIYIDGFYSPNPTVADFQLMKVESIQVLKGPQGTLFGRNTTGGAILVNTVEPSTETGGEFKASYGRFNEAQAQAYATFGISDKVAIDVEGLYSRGDNWQRNLTTGKKDAEWEHWTVRLGLKAELSDSVSVLLRYLHSERDDPTNILTSTYVDSDVGIGAPVFATPNQYTTDKNAYYSTIPRSDNANTDVLQMTINADLGFADLTSYSQYRDEIADSSYPLDHSALVIFQIGLPILNETWSQEFLLTSKPGSPLQWTTGLFYFQNTDRYVVNLDNNYPARTLTGGSSSTTESYAAFVDATYEITPQFFVTGGVRYAHDVVKDALHTPAGGIPYSVSLPSFSKDKITPRVVLRYKPTANSSIYASYTKGYKAGIYNLGGQGERVNPENIDAFEIGFKHDSRKFSFEGAAFYYDYQDLQVSLFENARATIVNATSSEIYGLEGQFRYNVNGNLSINGGAAWTHGRYKNFPNAPVYMRCPAPAGCGGGTSFFIQPTPLKNVDMQRLPEFTGNIGGVYKADVGGGELALSGNLYYTSSFYFGPSGIQFKQKGYETLSLRAQWTDPSDTYSIALWGDNVTNDRHLTQVQYNNFGIGAVYAKPVTYGIEVGARF